MTPEEARAVLCRWRDALDNHVTYRRAEALRTLLEENERLLDLVRHQRGELHETGLITDDEYAALVMVGSESARRLEGYDSLRARIEAALEIAGCEYWTEEVRLPLVVKALKEEEARPKPLANTELWARRFHDVYEALAPTFGYETREDTKAFDPQSKNGKLMLAVVGQLRAEMLGTVVAERDREWTRAVEEVATIKSPAGTPLSPRYVCDEILRRVGVKP